METETLNSIQFELMRLNETMIKIRGKLENLEDISEQMKILNSSLKEILKDKTLHRNV